MPSFNLLEAGHGKARHMTLRVAYAFSQEAERALLEQRISGVPGPFSSLQSLGLASVMCSKRPACCLIAATNSSSSSSAGKCQPNRLPVRKWKERC